MRLKITGTVVEGDPCRVSGEPDCVDGAIHVGGVDVVDEISRRDWRGRRVTVGIGDDRFDGDLFVETGWGYSEYTPMDADELRVGDHDLIEILRRHAGQAVTLYLFDEPGNLLDDIEWECIGHGDGARR